MEMTLLGFLVSDSSRTSRQTYGMSQSRSPRGTPSFQKRGSGYQVVAIWTFFCSGWNSTKLSCKSFNLLFDFWFCLLYRKEQSNHTRQHGASYMPIGSSLALLSLLLNSITATEMWTTLWLVGFRQNCTRDHSIVHSRVSNQGMAGDLSLTHWNRPGSSLCSW
jgi:hypothetical protein